MEAAVLGSVEEVLPLPPELSSVQAFHWARILRRIPRRYHQERLVLNLVLQSLCMVHTYSVPEREYHQFSDL